MRIVLPANVTLGARLILAGLAILFASAPPTVAQGAAGATPSSVSSPASFTYHGGLTLTGPWRFQAGDDPRWADPAFDDSAWTPITLDKPLSDQGIDPYYTGYAWYRLRIDPRQLPLLIGSPPLDLLVSGRSAAQLAVYINGVECFRTRGLTDPPHSYQSPPFAVPLSCANTAGPVVLAIRTWAGTDVQLSRGPLQSVEIGHSDDIADRLAQVSSRNWDQHLIAGLIVSLLFLSVALLGAVLFLAQRHHSEYLWMALLCLSVTANGAVPLLFGLAILPLTAFSILNLFTGRIFMAVTLEFVLRFTGGRHRNVVRALQVSVLLLPFVSLVGLEFIYEVLSLSAQVAFCGLVCFLLYRSWRRGSLEAAVMLLPFFLAATASSADTFLDYAAQKQWVSEQLASHRFYLGSIAFTTSILAFTVFLASLIAVILYRFVRVSQDEQRSEAEIAAARSVQSLLIPTVLPSHRNFVLESAYLPINGVGGDFFQVIPLKDDSLLIVVGDVSGKGLQAAMSSSTLVGALRNELSHDPATILDHLNHVLLGAVASPGALPGLDSAPAFATCLCARIYPDGHIVIANAGHLSPYRDGREMELEPNLPLGVIAASEYKNLNFDLSPGDRLVFLSDGVVEAANAQGELFGFERTQQVSHESARYIAQTAKHFGQTDDITVVSLYFAARTTSRSSRDLAANP